MVRIATVGLRAARVMWMASIALVAACGGSRDAAVATEDGGARAAIAAAPPPDAAPAPVAPVEVHVIARGDTLDAIARAHYGSRHYARLLALVDHASPTRLAIGASLALPTFDAMAATVAARQPDATAALVRAQATWKTDPKSAATDAEAARAAYAAAGAPVGQLAALVTALRGIADGHADPNHYARDDIDRRFADGLAALISWAGR
jgi:LysM repeat protein